MGGKTWSDGEREEEEEEKTGPTVTVVIVAFVLLRVFFLVQSIHK